MPDLNTTLHLDMWRLYKARNSFVHRLRGGFRGIFSPKPL